MERVLLVESLRGERVAEVRQERNARFTILSTDKDAVDTIEKLIQRGRDVGLIYCHDHHQKTNRGQIYRTYGRWSKPGDPDFLEALADALVEFNLFAYVVELVG